MRPGHKSKGLGSILLDEGLPKIVVSIADDPASLEDAVKANSFDVVEFRIDLFASLEIGHIREVLSRFKSYPRIATIRSPHEGGAFKKSEEERLVLFKKVIPYVDAMDIELSARALLQDLMKIAHQKKKKIILSYHHFDETPSISTLNRIIREANSHRADFVKIATWARNPTDVQQLAKFTIMHAGRGIITVAMGPLGALSRLCFPALGSLLTYAHIGRPTAPGQMACTELAPLMKRFYPVKN